MSVERHNLVKTWCHSFVRLLPIFLTDASIAVVVVISETLLFVGYFCNGWKVEITSLGILWIVRKWLKRKMIRGNKRFLIVQTNLDLADGSLYLRKSFQKGWQYFISSILQLPNVWIRMSAFFCSSVLMRRFLYVEDRLRVSSLVIVTEGSCSIQI